MENSMFHCSKQAKLLFVINEDNLYIKFYQCIVCGKLFNQLVISHVKLKTIKCPVCGELFTRSTSYIKLHEHRGLKQLLCGNSKCTMAFIRKLSYKHTARGVTRKAKYEKRNEKIVEMLANGYRKCEIAKKFGIKWDTVYQLIKEIERKKEAQCLPKDTT